MIPFIAVLAVLATYRLTLLVVADELTEDLRKPAIAWLDRREHFKLATLIGCPWCASWWIGLPVAWSAHEWGTEWWWQVGALGLAASAVTGLLATFASPE
jgi:hypothetical protein